MDELPLGFYMQIEGALTDIAPAEKMLEIENFTVESKIYPKHTSRFGTQSGKVTEAKFKS